MDFKFVAFYIVVVNISINYLTVLAQIENPERKCESTGRLCIDSCSGVTVNDQYQWCGSCSVSIRCLDGVATFYGTINPDYPVWDDYKKSFELTSHTCAECYYECPPGASVPPHPTVPQCDNTGLGCIDGPNSCVGFPHRGNYQYCGNCTHYVYCGGFSGPHTFYACPVGTVFDAATANCQPQSSTCVECYELCLPPGEGTPEVPTTPPIQTSTPGDGEYTCISTCTCSCGP